MPKKSFYAFKTCSNKGFRRNPPKFATECSPERLRRPLGAPWDPSWDAVEALLGVLGPPLGRSWALLGLTLDAPREKSWSKAGSTSAFFRIYAVTLTSAPDFDPPRPHFDPPGLHLGPSGVRPGSILVLFWIYLWKTYGGLLEGSESNARPESVQSLSKVCPKFVQS